MLRVRAVSSFMRGMQFSTAVKEIRKVGVVGLGLMGHGIAQVTAQAGFEVVAIEAKKEALDTGITRIDQSLKKIIARDVKKGVYTQEAGDKMFADIKSKITTSTDMSAAADCDMVVEAIAENMDLKINFYKNLGSIVKPSAIFASNTSSLQITAMAEASGRSQNFVGLHFFNPVQIMKLVEIIRTENTTNEVYKLVEKYVRDVNKTPVVCGDTPGFIVNRLLIPYLTQAMAMVDRNVASVADIDVAMQLGAGHPMGPLHLADYVGLDTCHSILKGWVKNFPDDPAFFVPKVLEKMVSDGHYGRKSGRGFYHWDGDKVGSPAL